MSGEWQNGLCGCFSNIGVCVISYFLPCYTFGKNAEAVGDDCLLCGLSQLVPLANIWFRASIRGKIREQKGIQGSLINDILLVWCCYLCTVVQEANEIRPEGGPQAQSMARE